MTNDLAKGYWERNASRYDRSMAILGGPLPRMTELTREAIQGSGRVLEVAAGTGLVTRAIARDVEELVSTDYSEAMVSELRHRVTSEGLHNVRCAQADIYALSYAPGTFDAVVAANVLHLVPNLDGALKALVDMLRPGGRILAPTYCHDEHAISWLMSRLLAVTGFPGQRRFTMDALVGVVQQAGLEVVQSELITGLLPIGFIIAEKPRGN